MEKTIVNKPLVNTFGWLGVNGTEIDAPTGGKELSVTVDAGEERTVVLSEAVPSVLSADVGKNGVLRLIQARLCGGAVTNDIRVRCGENARFEWYRLVLGGTASYDNCSVTLQGDGSSFLAEYGYRLGGTQRLDVNCEAIHLGKRTRSDIHTVGVLRDRAFKLFRGVIDLRRGCAGSEGNEIEDVLLMDETVRNQTVPVILCGEEDVAGNHGATIGRLDEDLVYYLASRGMSREEIYELMARARVDAVIARIPDENVRRALRGMNGEATA